jgi:hypothetical protein
MAETQTGGIIYPPPDIRGVIDTTAQVMPRILSCMSRRALIALDVAETF